MEEMLLNQQAGNVWWRPHSALKLLTGLCVDLAEAVVAHLVHEAVEQDRWALTVHSELSSGSVVVVLLDVFACVCASPNADHPQKLVDVCDKDRDKLEKCARQTVTWEKCYYMWGCLLKLISIAQASQTDY